MSVTVDFTTVTKSIAALNISGVTVKDYDQVSASAKASPGSLVPMPENFVSDVELIYDETTGQKLSLSYTLHYRYYHAQIGNDLLSGWSAMLTKSALILLAFANDATLAGAVNTTSPHIDNMGPVQDPSGNAFHGADFSLRVMQFLEV